MFLRPRFLLFSLHLLPHCAIDWNHTKPCATPLVDELAGRVAGPIPNESYANKFCIDVDSEHTPINLPSRNMGFQQEYDATIAAPEDLNLPRHSVAPSSSSQHSAASNVPTLSNLASAGTSSKKLVADYGAVVIRTCIKEICATVVSKGKKDRDQNIVQTVRDRQNIHKVLERKAELAVRGEKLAQQRSSEADAEVEIKNLGQETFRYCSL